MLLVYALILESTQLVCWAYTFPDCLLASRSTHTTQRERMQRKFHGFPTTVPLILMNSCFPALRTCESFCLTTLQFLSSLDSSDTTSNIPYANLNLSNETICWLVGAWPRFRDDLAKQIPVLLALSEIVHGVQTEVSPEVVWEGARTMFLHPGDVWWVPSGLQFDPVRMSLCTLISTS